MPIIIAYYTSIISLIFSLGLLYISNIVLIISKKYKLLTLRLYRNNFF